MTLLEYSYLLKFIASLVIVIILLYSVYYFVLRYTPFQLKSGQNIIKVIDIKYISKGKGLILVKIKNSMILLGFDEKNLTKIKEWEDEEIPASDS